MQFYGLLLMSFLGFLVSFKLVRDHGLKRPSFCPKEFGGGCDIVKHSKYSWFLGLPVALWGGLYYLVFIVLIRIYYYSILENIFYYSIFGLLFSLRLFLLQKYKIKAYCFWCILQTIISIILFLFLLFIYF